MADKPQINSPGEEKGLQELEKELEKIRDEIRAAHKKQDRPQALRRQIEEAKKELAAITGDTYGKITFFYKRYLVSMIRKYHNHKLQTNPWNHEEVTQKSRDTRGH